VKLQVAADWVEAPLKAFVDDARAEIAVLMHPTGQVLGQFGFTRSVDVQTACALGAAIYASAGELGRQMQGRPFGVMHYAGKDKQVFLAPVPIAGGTLLLLSVFGEESSLGLVQLYFQDFQRAVSHVAPQWKGAESALASDFEAELNKNLAAMFGRG
jgi:predicted regulator of Ras-like GTPase activity (Roadblock/LC7/MglB family)